MLKTGDKDRVVFSHRPIRIPEDMLIFNVHGHIHEKSLDDLRYFNISVERLGYTPIQWEDLHKKLLERKQHLLNAA